jgi:glutamate racemase
VASGAYERALADEAPAGELHAVASAELATLIQEGGEVDHRVVGCVDGLCRPLRAAGVDTVILGCTHYPLVRPVLQRALGRGVAIVSSGQAIADEVEAQLRQADLENDHRRRGEYRFLATGEPDEFRRLGTRFLQLPITEVERVAVSLPGSDHRVVDHSEPSAAARDGAAERRAPPRVTGDPNAARSLA